MNPFWILRDRLLREVGQQIAAALRADEDLAPGDIYWRERPDDAGEYELIVATRLYGLVGPKDTYMAVLNALAQLELGHEIRFSKTVRAVSPELADEYRRDRTEIVEVDA